jgi:hypothetical protein
MGEHLPDKTINRAPTGGTPSPIKLSTERMLSIVDQGPFEMIDMCNTLGIEPVITTTDTSSAEDFAGLVEYCYGNESTTMGAKRHSDGHPEPYRVRYFELGNEEYNTHYVEQVAAMEAKAQSLGIAKTLYYMFPSNDFLNDDDLAKAAALSPRIDSQLLADLHVVLFMPAASDPLSPPSPSLTHPPCQPPALPVAHLRLLLLLF